MSSCCSHETLLHVGLQQSHLAIDQYHRDRHQELFTGYATSSSADLHAIGWMDESVCVSVSCVSWGGPCPVGGGHFDTELRSKRTPPTGQKKKYLGKLLQISRKENSCQLCFAFAVLLGNKRTTGLQTGTEWPYQTTRRLLECAH